MMTNVILARGHEIHVHPFLIRRRYWNQTPAALIDVAGSAAVKGEGSAGRERVGHADVHLVHPDHAGGKAGKQDV